MRTNFYSCFGQNVLIDCTPTSDVQCEKRMHSSRMLIDHLLAVSASAWRDTDPPECRHPCGQTNTCENTTSPQTSLAGVNSQDSFNPDNFTQCVHVPEQFKEGETRILQCDHPVRGQYVAVYMNRKEVLTLCEVEVYGMHVKGQC